MSKPEPGYDEPEVAIPHELQHACADTQDRWWEAFMEDNEEEHETWHS